MSESEVLQLIEDLCNREVQAKCYAMNWDNFAENVEMLMYNTVTKLYHYKHW